ncbi:MAG: signal peptidase I [Candidatus Omnitrophota bacterium]|nr:signal peptidase I [Candidatus Omnitrophota bacterium]
MNSRIKAEIKEWRDALIVALALALFIQTFFIQAFKIPSGSMIPAFEVGDRIFVNKFLYSSRVPFINLKLPIPSFREPKRGDIIVFVSPEDPKKDFVKRLIAVSGETVEIRQGKIYINGKTIDANPSISSIYYLNAGGYGKEGQQVKVPEGCYYTLGDNSGNSRDSRYWGFVPKKNFIGKAVILYWPLNRMRMIR